MTLENTIQSKMLIAVLILYFCKLTTAESEESSGIQTAKVTESGTETSEPKHLIGNIMISKRSVSEEILKDYKAQTKPTLTDDEAECAPPKWQNVQCMNSSLGWYTGGTKFITFGTGPFGMTFPGLFGEQSEQSKCHKKKLKKVMDKADYFIEKNAEMKAIIANLENTLQEIKIQKRGMEEKLKVAETNNAQQERKIAVLEVRVQRWEDGHKQCSANTQIQKEASSVALRTCQNRVDYMSADSAKKMGIIRSYIKQTGMQLTTIKNLQEENMMSEISISKCETSAASSRETLADYAKQIQDMEIMFKEHEKRWDDQYKTLKQQYTSCNFDLQVHTTKVMSLEATLEDLRVNRDECLNQVSHLQTKLDRCQLSFRRCRGKHNVTIDAGKQCDQDLIQCNQKTTNAKAELMTCKSNEKVLQNRIKNAESKIVEFTENINTIRGQLEDAEHKNDRLELSKTDLEAKLEKQKKSYADIWARLTSQTIKYKRIEAQLTQVTKQKNEALDRTVELATEIKETREVNARINADLILTKRRLRIVVQTSRAYQKKFQSVMFKFKHNRESLNVANLQIRNITDVLGTIKNQRDLCYKKKNESIARIDQWKIRFEQCNMNTTAVTSSLSECKANLQYIKRAFKKCEQEADTLHNIKLELEGQLNRTLESLKDLTITNEQLQDTVNTHVRDRNALGKRLHVLQNKLNKVSNQYTLCSEQLSRSQSEIAGLQIRTRDLETKLSKVKATIQNKTTTLQQVQLSLALITANLTRSETALKSCQGQIDAMRVSLKNKEERISTLRYELNACQQNQTATSGYAQDLEQKLRKCEELMELQQKQCQDNLHQCETDFKFCQDARADDKLAMNKLGLRLTDIQNENTQCKTEKDEITKKLEYYTVEHDRCKRQLAVKNNILQNTAISVAKCNDDLGTAQNISKKCEIHSQEKSQKIIDLSDKMLNLTLASEDCQSSQVHECPTINGKKPYVQLTQGNCVFLTTNKVSHKKTKDACKSAKGELISITSDNMPARMFEIQEFLQNSRTKPQSDVVWVQTNQTKCMSLDIKNLMKDPINPKLKSESCTALLQGICWMRNADMNEKIWDLTLTEETHSSGKIENWNDVTADLDE